MYLLKLVRLVEKRLAVHNSRRKNPHSVTFQAWTLSPARHTTVVTTTFTRRRLPADST